MSATEAQALDALRHANEVRMAHAVIKQRIRRQGRVHGPGLAADLLEEPAGEVLSMRVGALLLASPRVGSTQVARWLRLADVVSSDKRVGDLTVRQRHVLVAQLRAHMDRKYAAA